MPNHYLNQCWKVVNWTLRNKRQGSFNHEANMGPTWVLSAPDGPHVGPMVKMAKIFNDENALEKVVYKMTAIFFFSASMCYSQRLIYHRYCIQFDSAKGERLVRHWISQKKHHVSHPQSGVSLRRVFRKKSDCVITDSDNTNMKDTYWYITCQGSLIGYCLWLVEQGLWLAIISVML